MRSWIPYSSFILLSRHKFVSQYLEFDQDLMIGGMSFNLHCSAVRTVWPVSRRELMSRNEMWTGNYFALTDEEYEESTISVVLREQLFFSSGRNSSSKGNCGIEELASLVSSWERSSGMHLLALRVLKWLMRFKEYRKLWFWRSSVDKGLVLFHVAKRILWQPPTPPRKKCWRTEPVPSGSLFWRHISYFHFVLYAFVSSFLLSAHHCTPRIVHCNLVVLKARIVLGRWYCLC